jgi:hypothetical protein
MSLHKHTEQDLVARISCFKKWILFFLQMVVSFQQILSVTALVCSVRAVHVSPSPNTANTFIPHHLITLNYSY